MIYLFKNKYIKVALGVMCLFTLLFGVIALYLAIDFILWSNGGIFLKRFFSEFHSYFDDCILVDFNSCNHFKKQSQ